MRAGNSLKLLVVFPAAGGEIAREVAAMMTEDDAIGATALDVARPTDDLQPRDHLPATFFSPPELGPVDAILECRPSIDVSSAFRRIAGAAAEVGAPELAGYGVVEEVLLDRARDRPDVGPTPGLKMVSMGRRHPSLSLEDAARHWREVHGPLALRHHVGMSRYIQNLVAVRVGSASDEVDLVAELSFPSVHGFVHRFFDSPEGRRAIAADARVFAGGGDTHFFVEEMLPGARQSTPATTEVAE